MFHDLPDSDEFEGFDEARRIMWCYEHRALVFAQIHPTAFLEDERLSAVHVDNTTRADRVFLTAFDCRGRQLDAQTIYIDNPTHRLDVAPEFDHDFTNLLVQPASQLHDLIAKEIGWVINLTALRAYDPAKDRRATQRAVLLAHLKDMMRSGQARGFLIGNDDAEDDAA